MFVHFDFLNIQDLETSILLNRVLAALNNRSMGQANFGDQYSSVQPRGQEQPPPERTSRRTTAHDNPGFAVDQTGFFLFD